MSALRCEKRRTLNAERVNGEAAEQVAGEEASSPVADIESSMSEPLRQISIDVKPAARAPATAENRLTAHAGVGCPMYVTQLKMRQNIQQQSDQKG